MTASPQAMSADCSKGWMSAAHASAAGPEAGPSSCLLCQGAAPARPQPAGPVLPIPPLQWHCQHLPALIGPGAKSPPSFSAHSTERIQPPAPRVSQTTAAAFETLFPALLSTSGTGARGRHAGRKLWLHGHELGQVPTTSQQ